MIAIRGDRMMNSVSVYQRWVVVGLACFVLGLTGMPARADLVLEIVSPKTHYLLDEPLFVTVTIRNAGAADVPIFRALDPGSGFLTFEIVPPGEQPRQYKPLVSGQWSLRGLAEQVVHLGSGERYSSAADLTCEAGVQTVLSQAGEYVIRALYAIREGLPAGPVTIRSNELSLLITQPQGRDRAAYEALYQGARTADRGPWNSYSDQAACYEQLLHEFAESGYAIHARFYLAQVYESDGGEGSLRGTPDGAGLLQKAGVLYASVAEEAGDTPLGVYAKRVAGRCFANLGDVAQAQVLFEQAFLAPGATDGDRLEVLSWLGHLQSGLFQESAGLGRPSTTTQLRLPLRPFAEALGFSVDWDSTTRTVVVRNSKVGCTLQPHKDLMVINGTEHTGVTMSLKDGHLKVPVSVIDALMTEQRGACTELLRTAEN